MAMITTFIYGLHNRFSVTMDQDEKITLRISKEALLEIDEFLENHQDLGTRSEFIRNSCLRYIRMSRLGQDDRDDRICIKLRGLTEKLLERAVNMGIYSDLQDAVASIITEIEAEGILPKLIAGKLQKYKEAENLLSTFDNLTEQDKRTFHLR